MPQRREPPTLQEALADGIVPQAPAMPRISPVGRAESENSARLRPTTKEKRRFARAGLSTDVSLYSESHVFAGLSEDVSEGGVFVTTHELRPIGTEVDVAFTLPTGHEVKTRGVVRWSRALGPGCSPGIGVQFTLLRPVDLDAIRKFVKHRPPLVWDDEPL